MLIDHLRGSPAARTLLVEARDRGERLVASVLTKIEMLAGMRPAETARTRALLDELEWIDVDDAIAERAGGFARRYARSHPGIDVVDFVVAATAEAAAAELWTRNATHFPMFRGLEPPY